MFSHRIDLIAAIHWVLECCRGHRLPEPTRLARLVAVGSLKPEENIILSEAGYQEKLIV